MVCGEFFTAIAAVAAAISAGVSLKQMFVQRKHEKEQQKTVNRISWYNKITLETIVPMLNEMTDYAAQHLSELNNRQLSDDDINCAKEMEKIAYCVFAVFDNKSEKYCFYNMDEDKYIFTRE